MRRSSACRRRPSTKRSSRTCRKSGGWSASRAITANSSGSPRTGSCAWSSTSATTVRRSNAMSAPAPSWALAEASTGSGPRAASSMRRRSAEQGAAGPPKVAVINNPKVRSAVYQIALLVTLAWLAYEFVLNTRANLEAQGFASGVGFLHNTAGFGINQTLIAYNESDTYARVFLVGLLNTLLVAGLGIVFATIIGVLVGVGRLSPNWLLARLAGGYVELIRNLPLLFQILFWYLAVLGALPGPRQSLSIFGEVFLNNRGVIVPAAVFGEGANNALVALALAVLA